MIVRIISMFVVVVRNCNCGDGVGFFVRFQGFVMVVVGLWLDITDF